MRHVLGEALDISFDLDKNTQWLCDGPTDQWVMGDINALKSLDSLAILSGRPLQLTPSKIHEDIFKQLAPDVIVKWRYALSKREFDKFLASLLAQARDVITNGCIDYYESVYMPTQKCLASIDRMMIDHEVLRTLINSESNHAVRTVLTSFIPASDGLATPIEYDRFSTLTGRMTVKFGPKLLTLAKKHKHIIKSRFHGGKVLSIDYRSMEPRILLLAAGKDAPIDVYDDLIAGLTISINRDVMKIIVISLLYGASEKLICKLASMSVDVVHSISQHINRYFALDELASKLEIELAETSNIKTMLGRPIFVSNIKNVINNFAQGTAVDLALLGFERFISAVAENEWLIQPVGIIHDALIVDVHPDYVDICKNNAGICELIRHFTVKFPVKVEEIHV